MNTNKTAQATALNLQIREYVERYHPELGEVSVEIEPGNTVATVRCRDRRDRRKGS